MDWSQAQAYLAENRIDGWLLYDFRGSNPIFWQALGETKRSTRRNFLLVPRQGQPTLLVHPIDADLFNGFGLPMVRYVDWPALHAQLRRMLGGMGRVAMEYSPGGAIPIVSYVDAGTVELIRGMGVEVVSSAGAHQAACARWDEPAYASHVSACERTNAVKDEAFAQIAQAIAAGKRITEYDIQQFIMERFAANSLIADHPPIVGVNANSGNPHYEPTAQKSEVIRAGDWVLIDLWAKHPGERNVYADMTWVGVVGETVGAKQAEVFAVVKSARDGVVRRVQEAWKAGEMLMGWQVDRVARDIIEKAGYGKQFIHRTGHSMGPGDSVHALGVNMDDLETHDTRPIVAGVGFSVEPGIYLPEFGVRLEIDMYVHPQRGPIVTTSLQQEPVRMVAGRLA